MPVTQGRLSAEVVVVGGGIEGCAAAWQLGLLGVRDVLVLERDTVASGGTGKSSGVVRCHYGVRSLAAMAWRSLEVFERALDLFDDDLGFRQCGYVVGVGPDDVSALRANLATQREVGVEVEEVDHGTVAAMWPAARLDDVAAFGFEPRGGYADAYRAAMAFAAAARRGGARVLQRTPVASVLVEGGRAVGVRLADGSRVDAGAVVVAAGPWSVPLLAEHGVDVPLRIHRGEKVLLDPGTDLGDVPVLSDLVTLQYLRAEPGGQLLFGDSDLSVLQDADPDDYPNRAGDAFLEVAATKVGHRFPGLPDVRVASTYAGCYDCTPDFNPVVSLTGVENLVAATGFSGHGFKISPAVGRLVADLVVHGKSSDPDVPEEDFRLSRFAEGALLTSPHPYTGAGQLR